MVVFILMLLYVGNFLYSLGGGLKLDYKETKYPIVNVNEDRGILSKVYKMHRIADCNGLLELYKKTEKDKVVRLKLRKKEAYYYARYIGVKEFIHRKLYDLRSKSRCNLSNSKVFNNFDATTIKKKIIEYIEADKLTEAKALINKFRELNKLFKLIDSLKRIRYKSIDSNILATNYEHSGTVQLERCAMQKMSYIPKYPENKFFIESPAGVVFFDGGKMYIYDVNNYLNEILSLYESIKIKPTAHNYMDLKGVLGVEQRGYRIYITLFAGKFFSGKTVERLGINASDEHIFDVPIYKIVAFDLYSKKVIWESMVSDSFSYLSAATIVDNVLYVMCGELTDRELTNYLCKLDIDNGKLLDKVYLSTDEVGAIAGGKNSVFYFENAKPYKKEGFLYLLLYSGGIIAKYDVDNNYISFVLRFRRNDLLPLPLSFNGEQIWVGEDTFMFFNSNHNNLFIVERKSGKLLNIISRGFLGRNIKKCYVLGNNYICVAGRRIFIFRDDVVKVINSGINDVFINGDGIFIIKNKKVYFAKNLFFFKMRMVLKLERGYYVEELAYTSKYLFIKGIKNGNCVVDIFEKK